MIHWIVFFNPSMAHTTFSVKSSALDLSKSVLWATEIAQSQWLFCIHQHQLYLEFASKQHRLRGLLRFRINYFVQEFFMGNAVYFLLHHDLRHMVPRSLIYGGPKISEWVQVRSVWSLYYKVPHSPFIEWF